MKSELLNRVSMGSALLILNAADAGLTLNAVLNRGAEEANPVMRQVLLAGPLAFLGFKFVVISALILFVCTHGSKAVIRNLSIVYVGVCLWHLWGIVNG